MMPTSVLSRIEEMISQLSYQERLWLIERLAGQLREDALAHERLEPSASPERLAMMAADPEIQAELQQIEQEFAGTESDGLE